MKTLRLSRKAKRAWQGRSRGFSLIEVVIAIALIGIIGVAILTSLSTASLALIMADKRATAESLARTQMEYVKNYRPYDETNNPPQYPRDPGIELPPGYNVGTAAVRLNLDEDPTDDDGIQEITVTVSDYGEVVVTLEDYKRKPETPET